MIRRISTIIVLVVLALVTAPSSGAQEPWEATIWDVQYLPTVWDTDVLVRGTYDRNLVVMWTNEGTETWYPESVVWLGIKLYPEGTSWTHTSAKYITPGIYLNGYAPSSGDWTFVPPWYVDPNLFSAGRWTMEVRIRRLGQDLATPFVFKTFTIENDYPYDVTFWGKIDPVNGRQHNRGVRVAIWAAGRTYDSDPGAATQHVIVETYDNAGHFIGTISNFGNFHKFWKVSMDVNVDRGFRYVWPTKIAYPFLIWSRKIDRDALYPGHEYVHVHDINLIPGDCRASPPVDVGGVSAGDGHIDILDLSFVSSPHNYGKVRGVDLPYDAYSADVNWDGVVDILDLTAVGAYYAYSDDNWASPAFFAPISFDSP